jgi:hypothetical protein
LLESKVAIELKAIRRFRNPLSGENFPPNLGNRRIVQKACFFQVTRNGIAFIHTFQLSCFKTKKARERELGL